MFLVCYNRKPVINTSDFHYRPVYWKPSINVFKCIPVAAKGVLFGIDKPKNSKGNHFKTRRKIFTSHKIFSSKHCTLHHIIWSFFGRNFCSDVILRNNFWTESAVRKVNIPLKKLMKFSIRKRFLMKYKFIERRK